MTRRKKRPDPFAEIAEAVITFAIESGISEELIDGVECISDGELELWLIGTGSTICMEADDGEEITITDDGKLGVKFSKNGRNVGLPLALPMEEVLTDVPCFKAGRVNRGKLRLVSGQGSDGDTQGFTRKRKMEKSPRRSTQGRKVGHSR